MKKSTEDKLSDLVLDKLKRRDDGIVRRTFGVTVKAGSISEKKRSLRVVFSSEAVDSYKEVVRQDWEKRISRFERNPVVLWNHNRSGFLGLGGSAEDVIPIGFASDLSFGDESEATLTFVDERVTPIAEKVWQGFRQGAIRAVSVGFIPHSVSKEKRDDEEIVVLSDNELFEISAVPVPANADAVARSASGERTEERQRLLALAEKQAGRPLNKTTPDDPTDPDDDVPPGAQPEPERSPEYKSRVLDAMFQRGGITQEQKERIQEMARAKAFELLEAERETIRRRVEEMNRARAFVERMVPSPKPRKRALARAMQGEPPPSKHRSPLVRAMKDAASGARPTPKPEQPRRRRKGSALARAMKGQR